MIQTFTAATIDSLTARMGARRLMRPHSMVGTHLSHGSCAGINEQYRRADSIFAAMCQIADPTRCGKYAVTVQTILRFPDHHLRATARRVVVFDEDVCSLATDLLDTLRAASAIGITANHIGVLKRLAVIELAAADGVRT